MILFHVEDVTFTLPQKNATKKWLQKVAKEEGYLLGDINFIFCSDEFLLDINKTYLQHDYYTDIITFDQSEDPQISIDGDMYISIDRVMDNANTLSVPFIYELHRVIVHGILHLCGYKDKTEKEEKEMRDREDKALLERPELLTNL